MQNVIGHSSGAFATTDKSPNYMSGALSANADLKYKYDVLNQDKADKEAQNKALADKAKAESDKAKNEQFDKFLTPYSGVATVDGMAIVATTQLAKAVADSQKEVDAGRKTQLEHSLLRTKAISDIGLLKINNDRIKAEAESYQNLVQEGKINPAFDAKYQQFNNDYQKGNFAYVFNPNGDSKMIRYENNEFGIPQGKEEISWGDFTTNKERTVLNNDFNNDIKDFKIANPAEKIEILGYDTKTGTKQLTQQGREAIALRVQEHLHNPDDLSNAYLAATGNAEKDITDPEKIKVSQDYLIKRYEKSYGVEKTVDEATGRANLNETKKQNKIVNDKEKATIGQPSVIIKEGDRDGVKLQESTRDFPITNAILKNAGGTESKATNAYVNKGGKMYLRIEKHGGATTNTSTSEKDVDGNKNVNTNTSTSEKQVEVEMLDFGKDADEIGRYAKKLGFKGANDFKNHLIKQSGGDKFITTPDERNNKIKAGEIVSGYRFLGGDPNNAKSWKKI